MSKLIVHSYPILVLPELAQQIGLNEAIFLQQLHYWLNQGNTKFKDDKFWVFNSYKNWKKDNFPFWSERTIRRISDNLSELGLIKKTSKYNKMKQDNTLWFTINYEALKPYENKAEKIFKEKQNEKEERAKNKIEKKKKAFKRSNNQCGQNDHTKKDSNNQYGQNDHTICPDWPDSMDKMTAAIQETTSETTLETTTKEQKKNIVVDEIFLSKFKEDFENKYEKYEAILNKNELKKMYIAKGKEVLIKYYNNFQAIIDSYINNGTKIGTPGGLFNSAVMREYTIPKAIEGKIKNNKPPQATNYEQREYDDDFFNSLYDNVKFIKEE